MANDDLSVHARQIVTEAQVVFAVVANSGGEILATSGELEHAEFRFLLSTLIDGPLEVRRTYDSLDGMILPQSSMQDDAIVYRHKPRAGLLELTGILLPQGDSSPESFALAIYQTGQRLDSVVMQHFADP